MARLQCLGIPLATAPGVVPGLLGIAFIIFGSILLVRHEPGAGDIPEPAIPASAAAADAVAATAHGDEFDWRRVALSWLLCVTYGGVPLRGGLPCCALTARFAVTHT